MRAGHCENVRGPIDQRRRQRLAAQIAYICAFLCADLDRVQAWRLATNRVYARGCDFDVLAIASHAAKQPLCDRAPTNIASADKKDVFHGSQRAANALGNLEANMSKSISAGLNAPFLR